MVSLLSIALFAGLALGVSADATSDCPTEAQVRDALNRRVPASEADGERWMLRYKVEGDPSARRVAFRLESSPGQAVLERVFALPANQCLAAAATMAAMVERYLRDVGWTAGLPLPRATISREPTHAASAAGGISSETLWVTAGASIHVASKAQATATVGGDVHIVGPLRFALALFLPPIGTQESLAPRGSVEAQEWPLQIAPMLAFADGPFEWSAGPQVLLALEVARASGISSSASGSRVLASIGAGGCLSYRLAAAWRVGMDIALYRSLSEKTFYVTEGATEKDVLSPPDWQALAGISVRYLVLP
ncbi:MAG TPA: hypothetical protein VGY54_23460 [Polyangiaceae bacterium]|nr:hypothetical protein [Polyangiaceae bacterium]